MGNNDVRGLVCVELASLDAERTAAFYTKHQALG
jgi:hypothetical protein